MASSQGKSYPSSFLLNSDLYQVSQASQTSQKQVNESLKEDRSSSIEVFSGYYVSKERGSSSNQFSMSEVRKPLRLPDLNEPASEEMEDKVNTTVNEAAERRFLHGFQWETNSFEIKDAVLPSQKQIVEVIDLEAMDEPNGGGGGGGTLEDPVRHPEDAAEAAYVRERINTRSRTRPVEAPTMANQAENSFMIIVESDDEDSHGRDEDFDYEMEVRLMNRHKGRKRKNRDINSGWRRRRV